MSTDSESKVHDSGNIQETTVPRNEQQDEVFDSTQPGFPVFHRKVGSPLPLGTFLISGILWVIGLLLVGTSYHTKSKVLIHILARRSRNYDPELSNRNGYSGRSYNYGFGCS